MASGWLAVIALAIFCDDEPALPKADWREDVDDAGRILVRRRLEDYAPGGERRGEVLEVDDAGGDGRLLAIHGVHVAEAEEPVAVAGIADRAFDDVAGPEGVAANLLLGDEDVLRVCEEVVLRGPEKTMPLADDLEAPRGKHRTSLG